MFIRLLGQKNENIPSFDIVLTINFIFHIMCSMLHIKREGYHAGKCPDRPDDKDAEQCL